MNRTEIVKELALRVCGDTSAESVRQTAKYCDTLVDVITDALLEGKKIQWKGFIGIEVAQKKPHKGRHPATNEVVTFPEKKAVKCKISKLIKDMVNES